MTADPGLGLGPEEQESEMFDEIDEDLHEGAAPMSNGQLMLEAGRLAIVALVVLCLSVGHFGPGIIASFKSCPAVPAQGR